MKLLTRIPAWLRNKYMIAMLVFVAILFFFDKNDIFTQLERKSQLNELEESKTYYTREIQTEHKILEDMQSNPGTLEEFAREKYLMKRENEDLFIIDNQPIKGKE